MIDLQFWGTMLLLAIAVGYCLLRLRRSWLALRAGGCSSSCGCPSKKPETQQPGIVPADELTARLRKRTLIEQ